MSASKRRPGKTRLVAKGGKIRKQRVRSSFEFVTTCIGCGCTDIQACVDDLGTPCHWIARIDERGICSECGRRMFEALLEIPAATDEEAEWRRAGEAAE
jgi:hypothetical protein